MVATAKTAPTTNRPLSSVDAALTVQGTANPTTAAAASGATIAVLRSRTWASTAPTTTDRPHPTTCHSR